MSSWDGYLADFHERHPGTIGAALERCRAGTLTPHQWLVRPVAIGATRILDLACGSGSAARHLASDEARRRAGRRPLVIGVDRSHAELKLAAHEGQPVLRAEAGRLPLADRCVDAVISSMGLAVVRPLPAVLRECARVLVPGGLLVATVPSLRPLTFADFAVLSPLTARLRTPPQFPGRGELPGLPGALRRTGFFVLEDARERFTFRVTGADDAELLIGGLYLPGTPRRAAEMRSTGWPSAPPDLAPASTSRSRSGESSRCVLIALRWRRWIRQASRIRNRIGRKKNADRPAGQTR